MKSSDEPMPHERLETIPEAIYTLEEKHRCGFGVAGAYTAGEALLD